MDPRCDTVIDRLAFHFASRRDGLDVIGRFGNRFEHWVKWEVAVALHVASFLDDSANVNAIAVERDDCDVFVGANEWPQSGNGYPSADNDDIWVELKCRSTFDKGPGELVAEVVKDLVKLRARKARQGLGSFLALALIVEHPRSGLVDDWVREMTSHPQLTNARVRRIYVDQRYGGHEGRVLAALVACAVDP